MRPATCGSRHIYVALRPAAWGPRAPAQRERTGAAAPAQWLQGKPRLGSTLDLDELAIPEDIVSVPGRVANAPVNSDDRVPSVILVDLHPLDLGYLSSQFLQ